MGDLVHGRDYLIDWYAILDVGRDADGDAIHRAYLRKRIAWNTDVIQGLAPEIVKRVTDQARFINDAAAVLEDPVQRAEYDAQLSSWTGPISTTGLPVEDVTHERLDIEPLFFGKTHPEAAVERARGAIAQIAGFDEATFEVLEEIVLRGNPNPKQCAAYRRALLAKQKALTLEESLAWAKLGFKGRTNPILGAAQLEASERQIADSRALIAAQGASFARQLAAGELKLLEAPEGATGGGQEVALPVSAEEFVVAALQRFDQGAREVREAQQAKSGLLAKRLRALQVSYVGEQPVLFDDFIIGISFRGKVDAALRFHAEGLRIHAQGLTGSEHEVCEDPEKARELFLSGVNVLVVEAEEGLTLDDVWQRAAIRHLAKKMNVDEESIK